MCTLNVHTGGDSKLMGTFGSFFRGKDRANFHANGKSRRRRGCASVSMELMARLLTDILG